MTETGPGSQIKSSPQGIRDLAQRLEAHANALCNAEADALPSPCLDTDPTTREWLAFNTKLVGPAQIDTYLASTGKQAEELNKLCAALRDVGKSHEGTDSDSAQGLSNV